MKRSQLVISVLLLFFSCKENKLKQIENIDTDKPELISIDSNKFHINESEIDGGNPPKEYVNPDTTVVLNYPEFSVSISRLVVYEEKDSLVKMQDDTTYLTIDLAETLEGQKIEVITELLKSVTVEQSYQTSLTIYGEGPHCDLLEWKHYTSIWKTLKGKRNIFIANKYTDVEREKFPKVPLEEVRAIAKSYCQGKFFKLIGEITSLNKEPCQIGISSYYLRISGINPKTNKKVVKLIVFENLMGC